MELSTLYRWEDSPGLEHSCWKCGTKQKNPKARRSCYGTHTEPCVAYHQTLFAVGRSHVCKACINTEASHYERHLVIAKMIDDVKSNESVYQSTPLQKRKKAAKQETDSEFSACDESIPTDTSSIDCNPREDADITVKPEETFASPSERRSHKKIMKEKKSQEKAFRNQQKFVVPVSQAHVDRVARVIHGEHYNVDKIGGHPGTQDKDIDAIFERNDAYNAAIQAHRLWLKEQVRGSRARRGKQGGEAQQKQHSADMENGMLVEKQDLEQLVSEILAGLGLRDHGSSAQMSRPFIESATPHHNRKQRASLLLKLREEIAADIEKSENERRARQQRMEGYWRYVNGTVTDRLANNAQSVDRATGVKLKGDDSRFRLPEAVNVDQAGGQDAENLADGFDEEAAPEGS